MTCCQSQQEATALNSKATAIRTDAGRSQAIISADHSATAAIDIITELNGVDVRDATDQRYLNKK